MTFHTCFGVILTLITISCLPLTPAHPLPLPIATFYFYVFEVSGPMNFIRVASKGMSEKLFPEA